VTNVFGIFDAKDVRGGTRALQNSWSCTLQRQVFSGVSWNFGDDMHGAPAKGPTTALRLPELAPKSRGRHAQLFCLEAQTSRRDFLSFSFPTNPVCFIWTGLVVLFCFGFPFASVIQLAYLFAFPAAIDSPPKWLLPSPSPSPPRAAPQRAASGAFSSSSPS